MRAKNGYALRLTTIFLIGIFVASVAVFAADQALLSMNYKNTDLRDVLNALAAQAGVSISMDETVTGAVSFHYENVTFEECLTRLSGMFRLYITKDGRFYSVTRQLIKVTKETGDLVSVEFQTAKLGAVLAELTRVTGANVTTVGQPPADYVNLVLTRVPLGDLLNFLAESTRCQVEKRNGIYLFRYTGGQGSMALRYENGRLGVDLTGVTLSALVRELTNKTGQTVLCDQAVANTPITIFFAPLPLDEALTAIGGANGLRLYKEGEHYRFARGENTGVIRVQDGRLTLDVRNAEITEVLAEIARQSRINIIPQRDVSGRVSGVVTNDELNEGLDAFLENNGYVLERDNDVYYVKRLSSGASTIISVNKDGTLDLDITNANLALVATELAKRKGYGIVIYANVNWNVASVRLKAVPFDEALERLMSGTTFTFRREGDTYLIGEGVNFRQGDTDFIQSELIPLRHVMAEVVWNTIPAAFPRQNIVLLKETNALLVNGTPKLIGALKTYLSKLDVPPEGERTEVIPLKHMKAEDALKLLPPSFPKTDIILVKEVNSLAVTGSEGYRAQIRGYLAKIDVMAPMILFDVLVLQFTQNDSHEGGLGKLELKVNGQTISWGDPNLAPGLVGQIVTPNTPAALSLSATINAAISDGRAKIRANPKIATLSGNKAHFDVVTKYNYTMQETVTNSSGATSVQYKNFSVDSGITMDLVPWVSAEKDITLEIKPKISQYAPSEKVAGVTALPGVLERSSESTVRIKDGYTVVISGFVQDYEETIESKVPILGSIPIIGHLFRSTSKKKRQDEFVIIITPRLVEDAAEINKFMAEVSGDGGAAKPIEIDMNGDKRDKKKDPANPESGGGSE
ncbi:MAG: secretin N-terminal domain-containing protein [Bacteroidota bacterium]